MIKRRWTPREADSWTREDWIAIVISPVAYGTLMVGMAMSWFLLPIGFLILGISIFLIVFMHWVIDPKLTALSEEYEKHQKDYLKSLDDSVKWEEKNG